MASGDISDSLITELGYRLEDTGQVKFSSALLFEGLNYAQIRIAGLLDPSYLTEFENINSSVSIASGSVALSTVDSGGIINGANGIIACKVTPSGGTAQWAARTDITELRKLDDSSYFSKSDTNIFWYVFKSAIYFLLSTLSGSTADIYYLDYPVDITTDVDPTLNKALHPILVDFTEAYAWATDTENGEAPGRRQIAENKALMQIKILNERV